MSGNSCSTSLIPRALFACVAKPHRQGSSSHVPVAKQRGETCSFDLWAYDTPSICGGYHYLFGVICNFSSFGFIIAIKYKSEAPEAIREFLRLCYSVGVKPLRLHTDNENVFHSEVARDATITEHAQNGILVTTGCEYISRQNSVIEAALLAHA